MNIFLINVLYLDNIFLINVLYLDKIFHDLS